MKKDEEGSGRVKSRARWSAAGSYKYLMRRCLSPFTLTSAAEEGLTGHGLPSWTLSTGIASRVPPWPVVVAEALMLDRDEVILGRGDSAVRL